MQVSGFTVVRNAELMGYPILQSLQSLLPMVDELVVGVGQSDDNTRQLIHGLNEPKIKIFDSYWDTKKTSGGLILSDKTNEALEKCQNDWCFYLQADEVLHEEDITIIKQSLMAHANDPLVQGLLFDYLHFYGSYDVVASSRKWYRREIRCIKKSSQAQSHKDAQGFRVNGEKPQVKHCGGRIFHYGWVKPPTDMGRKAKMLDYWWHGDRQHNAEQFQYDNQYGLRKFTQTHPKVMAELVRTQNWKFMPMRTWRDWTLKDLRYWTSDLFEDIFDYRIGEYKPYTLMKD